MKQNQSVAKSSKQGIKYFLKVDPVHIAQAGCVQIQAIAPTVLVKVALDLHV